MNDFLGGTGMGPIELEIAVKASEEIREFFMARGRDFTEGFLEGKEDRLLRILNMFSPTYHAARSAYEDILRQEGERDARTMNVRGASFQPVREFLDLVENGYFGEAELYINHEAPERRAILEWEVTESQEYFLRNPDKKSRHQEFGRQSRYMPLWMFDSGKA